MFWNTIFLVNKAGSNLIADVQHVGSTSVPGLPAKPILDLAAAVATLGVKWANYLCFRDLLRADFVLRERYADLKHELRDWFSHSRKPYTDAKQDFIRQVLNKEAQPEN
jgi:GrpB-like predicted nucleotidyltransferase (UPF0157 family)